MKRSIVVINRIHTDEVWVGDAADELFEGLSIPGVRFVTREVPDFARTQRGVVENIITKFEEALPDGNADEQFAHRIKEKAQHADLVLDLHGTRYGESFGFCGDYPSDLALGVAALLGTTIVHCPRPHAASLIPNYAGWDISPDDVGRLKELPDLLAALTKGWSPVTPTLQHYRHAGKEVGVADAKRLGLARQYQEFERLPDSVSRLLGLSVPALALAWDADKNESRGYFGEVVTLHRP